MDKLTISIYNTSMLIPAQTPLNQYGGAELICANLAKYFDETGHRVNLFAPEGSYQPKNGVLYQTCKPGEKNADDVWRIYWENQQSKDALKNSDVVIDTSWGYYPYNVAPELHHLMHVCHGPSPGWERFPFPIRKPNLVGVSPNHAKVLSKMTNLEWRGVCNGINPDDYVYREDKEDWFLFLGRWDWFKAPHRAVEIADLGQKKVVIAGGSFGDVSQYVNDVKNKISQSKYVKTYGSVGNDTRDGMPGAGITHKEKVDLLSRAKAVILPNIEYEQAGVDVQNRQQWKTFIEPFGLIGLEANACGTPAIVLPSGGWHHSVLDGYNGFYAVSNQDYVDKMERVEAGEIDPKNCRKIAEHFNYKRMGDNYMHLIKKMFAGENW